MADHDETLMGFIAVTGCEDTEKAKNILESCDWNLEAACNLHFASEASDVNQPAAAATTSDGFPTMPGIAASADESAYMAQHGVRAPIAQKKMTLADDMGGAPSFFGPGLGAGIIAHGFGPGAQRGGMPGAGTAFDPFRDFAAEAEDDNDEQSAHSRKLADMYKPPTNLMYKGTFEEAKHRGKTDGKWLMVNIQKIDEFSSQTLNRDTWSKPIIQEIIKSAFVFWQVYHDSPEAQYFTQYYKHDRYPVISIIDPRTGAERKHWSGMQQPEDFMEKVANFLDRNDITQLGPSIASGANNANLGRSATTTTTSSNDQPSKKFKTDPMPTSTEHLTEDEQIAAAIAASLQDGGGASSSAGAAGAGSSTKDALPSPNVKAMDTEEAEAPSGYEPVPVPILDAEPAAGTPESTRLQLRLTDGSRAVRRFMKADKVSILYDFAVTKVEEAQGGRPFSLFLMDTAKGSDLSAQRDASLADANCLGSTVMMRWGD